MKSAVQLATEAREAREYSKRRFEDQAKVFKLKTKYNDNMDLVPPVSIDRTKKKAS